METTYQKFLSGEYANRLDPEVLDMMIRTKRLLSELNDPAVSDEETRTALLHRIFGKVGKHVSVGPNFQCECGKHISIGDRVVIQMNCTFLDDNRVTIGDNVLIAPQVQLYTATHPVAAADRFVENWDECSGDLFFRTRALPITIGNNVWIGGGAIVLPGVVIGDNSVIGAGSVVTRSVPADSLAAGNPCRVIRMLKSDGTYELRKADFSDIQELQEMYRGTLYAVNGTDYTCEEIEDWISCADNTARWKELIANLYFIVALDGDSRIVGFASIGKDGYLQSLFVHKDYQRKGVARFLLEKVEAYVREYGVKTIISEVSITARPFFEKMGYTIETVQKRKANRLYLTNYRMRKDL